MAWLENVLIDQAVAGTTVLRTAPHDNYRIAVINYTVVMTADGTLAFSDGTDWLSGDMPLSARGGVSARGTVEEPLMLCGRGRPLQLTTTGGAANGHALIRIE